MGDYLLDRFFDCLGAHPLTHRFALAILEPAKNCRSCFVSDARQRFIPDTAGPTPLR
jgi:hypothetical protein